MQKNIKIYIHTPSWHISKNNTDINLRRTLQSLQERFDGVELFIPHKWMAGIEFNLRYIYKRLLRYVFNKHFNSIEINSVYKSEYKLFNPDIVISQGHFPIMLINDTTPTRSQFYNDG